MSDPFRRLTQRTIEVAGSRWAFGIAIVIVAAWIAAGPLFRWSDSWQLVINTGTTIVTFLMVFLIQAAQNHDSQAIQLKLDELILAIDNARNEVAGIEREDEQRLNELDQRDR